MTTSWQEGDDDRRGVPPGRRDVDDWQTMLARIDERVKGVVDMLGDMSDELEKIEEAVDANTVRSLANEIASQRNSETIQWVSRTVLGVVIIAVLSMAGVASVAF